MSRYDEIFPLFDEYDMFAQTIEVLKDPNVYKAMTPFGAYVCKRTAAPPGRLQAVAGVLRHLEKRGWDGAVPYLYTKYDEPFVQRGDYRYYLTGWLPDGADSGSERIARWAPACAERLAELHHLTQNYRFDDPKQADPLVDGLLARWEGGVESLERYRSYAEGRSYSSPVDVVFLANCAFLDDAARSAIRQLRDWRERHRHHAHFRLCLVHGSPHPAHIRQDRQGKLRLINFDRSVFDTPARDMAAYFRQYFFYKHDEAEASDLLRRYTSIFPLRPDETELMLAFLTYPGRVIRLLDAYYGGERDWTELAFVKRLERDVDHLVRLVRWVRQAF